LSPIEGTAPTGNDEISVSEQTLRLVSSGGLVVGSALGLAGSFAPSASLRGLLWGLDGITLVVASALLTIHYFRRGNDVVAAGFLVFAIGEALILSTAAMDLEATGPTFGAGMSLWAASLYLLSVPRVAALWVRVAGAIAGLLFLVVAAELFTGHGITPLSRPLPFFAYPILVVTLLGWAKERLRA
jgi:hypothetical protein